MPKHWHKPPRRAEYDTGQRLQITVRPDSPAVQLARLTKGEDSQPRIHTYYASCTYEQHQAYACIEYAMERGLLDRHIYIMGMAPVAPTTFALIVMAREQMVLDELPLLFPGVDDWKIFEDSSAPDDAKQAHRTTRLTSIKLTI